MPQASKAIRRSGCRVPPRPPRDRPRARLAPRVEGARSVRLPTRPLRIDPAGPDRQTARIRPWPRDANLGPHLRLLVRDPRVELRPSVVEPPVRRFRGRHAFLAGSAVGDPPDRAVPFLRIQVKPRGV